jgi:hypothetical protein
MSSTTRSTALRIAAVLSLVVALIGLVTYDFDPSAFGLVFAGVMLVHHVVVIALRLWRERVPAAAE